MGSASFHVLCKLRFLLIFRLALVPGGVRLWDGVGGVSSAASQTDGMREGPWEGSGGVKAVLARAAALAVSAGCPGALGGHFPSPNIPWARLHGFGLDLVAFRPLGCHPRFKGVPAKRGQAVPSRRGRPWHQSMPAAGEHPSLIL